MPRRSSRATRATARSCSSTRGCLACHSIGEGDQQVGGEFAANLTKRRREGELRLRRPLDAQPARALGALLPEGEARPDAARTTRSTASRSSSTPSSNSRCPNDGAELQVQNMTVMPNFRLSDQDARDIATYLVSLARPAQYPDASYMDDPKLADTGQDAHQAVRLRRLPRDHAASRTSSASARS